MKTHNPWTFCVAPMMGWTDRHFRYFFRLASKHARLYTEMVTTGALIHGDAGRFLAYDAFEHPLALQLGGSDPVALARCARMAYDAGYAEVNLNVGCPSDRVKSGQFGACLMAEPQKVANCVAAMMAVVPIPITVKTRVGIDHLDSQEYFESFLTTLAQAGCRVFIVHARKAWLSGLSPKENREIPPLDIERVRIVKEKYPDWTIVLNGGLKTVGDCQTALNTFDGVMVGRGVYQEPYDFAHIDTSLFGEEKALTRDEWLEAFMPYMQTQCEKGVPLKTMTRHLLNVRNGQPGARAWRRAMSETPVTMNEMRAQSRYFSGGSSEPSDLANFL
ncbi:MAG: tRNA dihydrouridine(20/20a) synthase DusA [Gammaproteobacteria bacterium]